MNDQLTQGRVGKVLLTFTLPYLLSSFLQTFYGMADLYIVGRFQGAASITAVSVGSQFMHMVTVIIIGLSMGATVRIGHAIGSGRRQGVSHILGNTIVIFGVLALVLTVALGFSTSFVTKIMSTPAQAVEETKEYLFCCFMGLPFIIIYNVTSSIFRGLGDSKSPMYFIGIACVLNVVLDYWLIGGCHMGAKGAALATVTAQALSSLIAVVCLAGKMKKESFGKIRLKPEKSIMGEIFVSGVPIALQDGFVQVSFLIITIIANNRGLIPATSVGIVEKIISFLFLVPSAFSSSLSALVAHNVGAGNQRRADQMLKLGLLICVTYGFACAILCQIFPQSIVGAFTREQEVIKAGAQYLRPYAFDCGLAGIHFCFSGYFCGQGHSLISFLHNTISIVLVRVPGAYMLSRMFANTLMPMGIAAPAGSLLSSLICIAYFCYMRNRWQQKGENL